MDRKWIFILVLLLILVNISLRAARINSESPPLTNDFRNVAPYKDEGAKAHEARNRALFGSWNPHPADNYLFWSTQSPVWTWSLYFVFKIFGVSYASLRSVSIFFSAVTLAAGSFILYKGGHRVAAVLFPLVLGLNFYYLIFTRLGLMEPMMIAYSTICAGFLAWSRKRPAMLVLASLFLLAAIFTKVTAALIVPIWLLMAGVNLYPALRTANPKRAIVVSAAAVIVILVLAGAVLVSSDLREVLVYNLRHGLNITGGFTLDLVLGRAWEVVKSFFPGRLYNNYFLLLPISSVMGTGWIVYAGYRLFRGKRVSDLELVLLAWFVIGRIVVSSTPHRVVRFHLFYFVPIAMMATMALDKLWNSNTGRTPKRTAAVLVMAVGLIISLVPLGKWAMHPRYDMVQASRKLGEVLKKEEKFLGTEPVVIGEWVGPLSIENQMRCHYIKGPFNGSREQTAAFGITHLLESTTRYDPAVGRFKKQWPRVYKRRELVAEFEVRRRHLKLWRIPPVSEYYYVPSF